MQVCLQNKNIGNIVTSTKQQSTPVACVGWTEQIWRFKIIIRQSCFYTDILGHDTCLKITAPKNKSSNIRRHTTTFKILPIIIINYILTYSASYSPHNLHTYIRTYMHNRQTGTQVADFLHQHYINFTCSSVNTQTDITFFYLHQQ